MGNVATGFAVIALVIFAGYMLSRLNILGTHGGTVLTRLSFFLLTPALLIHSLAQISLPDMIGPIFWVSSLSAVVVGAIFAVTAKLLWKRTTGQLVVGALASSYVNSANLGIPIALFVLGELTHVAPLLLFQVVIYAPIASLILDIVTSQRKRDHTPVALVQHTAAIIVKNPLVIAGIIGITLSATQWRPPVFLNEPIDILSQAAVPVALLAYGMSLYGVAILASSESLRHDILWASALKLIVHPLVAYLMARFIFSADDHLIFISVIVAALPTAQNVYVIAARYQTASVLARDSAVITTLLSFPLMIALTALLNS